ncbi:hypothetical protein AMECASPLE_031819, partial [Ameca splendens]
SSAALRSQQAAGVHQTERLEENKLLQFVLTVSVSLKFSRNQQHFYNLRPSAHVLSPPPALPASSSSREPSDKYGFNTRTTGGAFDLSQLGAEEPAGCLTWSAC